jgi:hypothetical protein
MSPIRERRPRRNTKHFHPEKFSAANGIDLALQNRERRARFARALVFEEFKQCHRGGFLSLSTLGWWRS